MPSRRAPRGSSVVCMLPDTGERYLSTPLFDGIGEEMTEEELALSTSTPSYRFDVAAAGETQPAPTGDVDREAERFVETVVSEEGVVMFALAWCEFCWSARKLFDRLGIAYRSVDLDSVAYQADDLGGRIRGVLRARTGVPTIPQIFVGGEHIGGCTELFDAWRDGSLPGRLDRAGVEFDRSVGLDPYTLLPAWLHPRRSA